MPTFQRGIERRKNAKKSTTFECFIVFTVSSKLFETKESLSLLGTVRFFRDKITEAFIYFLMCSGKYVFSA